MFKPITLHRDDFTTTYRAKLKQQLDGLINQAISHTTDYSLYSLVQQQAYLTMLYTLKIYLVENPHNHRTIIYNKGQQQKPPTPDDLARYIENTVTGLIMKPPTTSQEVNMVRSFLIYYLKQIVMEN